MTLLLLKLLGIDKALVRETLKEYMREIARDQKAENACERLHGQAE